MSQPKKAIVILFDAVNNEEKLQKAITSLIAGAKYGFEGDFQVSALGEVEVNQALLSAVAIISSSKMTDDTKEVIDFLSKLITKIVMPPYMAPVTSDEFKLFEKRLINYLISDITTSEDAFFAIKYLCNDTATFSYSVTDYLTKYKITFLPTVFRKVLPIVESVRNIYGKS